MFDNGEELIVLSVIDAAHTRRHALLVRNTILQLQHGLSAVFSILAKNRTYSLEFIIRSTSNVLMRVADDSHHELRSLAFSQAENKAILQSLNRPLPFERG